MTGQRYQRAQQGSHASSEVSSYVVIWLQHLPARLAACGVSRAGPALPQVHDAPVSAPLTITQQGYLADTTRPAAEETLLPITLSSGRVASLAQQSLPSWE